MILLRHPLYCLVHCSVLPNEGYDEQYFDAYVDRWCQTAKNVTDGLQVWGLV